MRKIYSKLIILLLIIYLLLFPDTAFLSAGNGILLWFQKILPCLLPFCVLSNLMLSANMVQLKKPSLYVMIAGFLFGFPMGAKTAADLVRKGKLDYRQASCLIPICNMFSPVFISSYFVEQSIKSVPLMIPTFVILYGTALFALLFFVKRGTFIQHANISFDSQLEVTFSMIDQAIMDSFDTMIRLCGYIMFFSIIAGIVNLLPIQNPILKAIITSLIEVTNGISQVSALQIPLQLKYLILMPAISFGGLSGLAQTASFCKNTSISIRKYTLIRILMALITLVLTYLFLYPAL